MFSLRSAEEAELCPILTVTKAGYADCDGEYELTSWKQAHGRFRQVYKNTVKDRYIFFIGLGYGWSIGSLDHVLGHMFFHTFGPNTREPWMGTWRNGEHVICKQTEYKRYLRMYD